MQHVPEPDSVRPEPARGQRGESRAGTLEARVFRGLYPGLDLHSASGVHVAVPKGTPVFAGATLTAVVWQISGAAVRERCPNGTGWPARTTQ